MRPALAAIVVPLKSFVSAKSRLREAISADDLEFLARRLAAGVIEAASPRPCVVVCEDADVADFAARHEARVLISSTRGLNGAVESAYEELGPEFDAVIVAHGDLARPAGLGVAQFPPGVTIVTDRHGTGTNVLVVPTGLHFTFAYGEGSAARHESEARRLGLAVTFIRDSPWGLDVDGPEDLELSRG